MPAYDQYADQLQARLEREPEWAPEGRAATRALIEQHRTSAGLRERLIEAQAALTAAHRWHLAQTEEDEHGIIGAEAYAESTLCDQVMAALARPDVAPDQYPQQPVEAITSSPPWLQETNCVYVLTPTGRFRRGEEEMVNRVTISVQFSPYSVKGETIAVAARIAAALSRTPPSAAPRHEGDLAEQLSALRALAHAHGLHDAGDFVGAIVTPTKGELTIRVADPGEAESRPIDSKPDLGAAIEAVRGFKIVHARGKFSLEAPL